MKIDIKNNHIWKYVHYYEYQLDTQSTFSFRVKSNIIIRMMTL